MSDFVYLKGRPVRCRVSRGLVMAVLCGAIALLLGSAARANDPLPDTKGFQNVVAPFLKQHCLKCHGPMKQAGDKRFDTLSSKALFTPAEAILWHEMLDQLNAGGMPPPKEPRPDKAQVAAVIDWITAELRKADLAHHGQGQVVLRRLNRREYSNTMRDLLGVNTVLDPVKGELDVAELLPVDPRQEGYDNISSELGLSVVHLRSYLEAADRLLARVLDPNEKRPPSETWRFDYRDNGVPYDPKKNNEHNGGYEVKWMNAGPDRPAIWIDVRAGAKDKLPTWLGERHPAWSKGMPHAALPLHWRSYRGPFVTSQRIRGDVGPGIAGFRALLPGVYRVRVAATSGGFTDKWLGGPVRLAVHEHPMRRLLATSVDLPVDDKVAFVEAQVFAPRGGVELPGFYVAPVFPSGMGNNDKARPYLGVDYVEIEGPFFNFDGWPSPAQKRLLGKETTPALNEDSVARARTVLTNFMPRAWRRPVSAAEIAVHVELFKKTLPHKTSFHQALLPVLTSVLCSPHFLFLVERPADMPVAAKSLTERKARQALWLSDHELASRLSYFLWRSMPDPTLLDLARQGKLSDKQTLAAQAERMMRDPRSSTMIRDLADNWFGLQKLESFDPDLEVFPSWDKRLAESLREETHRFMEELMQGGGSVLDIVDSRWTFLNERLARHYGIEGVKGSEFRRVELDPKSNRGGLLTHASVLAATSTGQRTSPVTRGVFIRANLFHDPPPPPPANVPSIADKVPEGNFTVGKLMEQHRAQGSTCAACHARIDPWGLAFENYDGIGSFRTHEYVFKPKARPSLVKGAAIDSRGELPGGEAVDGMEGLKKLLLGKYRDAFVDGSIKRILTTATGRLLGPSDDAEIHQLRDRLAKDNFAFRQLILLVVQSDSFRRK